MRRKACEFESTVSGRVMQKEQPRLANESNLRLTILPLDLLCPLCGRLRARRASVIARATVDHQGLLLHDGRWATLRETAERGDLRDMISCLRAARRGVLLKISFFGPI